MYMEPTQQGYGMAMGLSFMGVTDGWVVRGRLHLGLSILTPHYFPVFVLPSLVCPLFLSMLSLLTRTAHAFKLPSLSMLLVTHRTRKELSLDAQTKSVNCSWHCTDVTRSDNRRHSG